MNTSIETSQTPLIGGNFQKSEDAELAVKQLINAGFDEAQIATVAVGLADDEGERQSVDNDEAPAGSGAKSGSVVGGAIGAAVGVASSPVLGPAAALAALGVGAYTGALYGALNTLGDDDAPDAAEADDTSSSDKAHRAPGTWVAAAALTKDEQLRAVDILRASGAKDIERTAGKIVQGGWIDFDPLAPTHTIRGLPPR